MAARGQPPILAAPLRSINHNAYCSGAASCCPSGWYGELELAAFTGATGRADSTVGFDDALDFASEPKAGFLGSAAAPRQES
jgi:hypothetical protein